MGTGLVTSRPLPVHKTGADNMALSLEIGPAGADLDTGGKAFYLSGVFVKYDDPEVTKNLTLKVKMTPASEQVTVQTFDLDGGTSFAVFPALEVPASGTIGIEIEALGAGDKVDSLDAVIEWL
jgi:hypothetical protein